MKLKLAMVIALSGCDSYSIHIDKADKYAGMVCAGAWHDWKKTNPDCNKVSVYAERYYP